MGADLVDVDGFLLVDAEGFALDESCSAGCCGSCPAGWLHLVQLDTGPIACVTGPPPPLRHLYICASVTCIGGAPLLPGTIVHIGGLCWVVQDEPPLPFPPAGFDRRDSLEPVLCGPNNCPSGELYYLSRPCNPEQQAVWVCGVTVCEIRGCHLLDPATGGVRFTDLPPGAITRSIEQMGAVSAKCCDCAPLCGYSPLVETEPFEGDRCFQNARLRAPCCCAREIENGQGDWVGRRRVVRMRTVQTVFNAPPGGHSGNNGTVQLETFDEEIDPLTGCATYGVRAHIDGFDRPPGGEDILDLDRHSYGCRACGGWPLRAERLTTVRGGGGFNYLMTGLEGFEWGSSCEGYTDQGSGTLEVLTWDSVWNCDRMTQTALYRWTSSDGNTVITTRFEWDCIVSYGVSGNGCDRGCGGVVPASADVDGAGAMVAGGIARFITGRV